MIINFKRLFDYNVFNNEESDINIFDDIKELITMVDSNDLKHFGNSLRKVFEKIFTYHELLPTPERGVITSILNLKKDNIIIPTNVLDGMYLIKNLSNRESHSNFKKSDINFSIEITKYEAKNAIRNLWLIIKWILIDINNNDEVIDFKYKSDINIKEISSYNPQLENQNDDMEPQKLSISSLIMSGEYTFNIPTYQRDYTWDVNKNKNILKLLNDIKMRSMDNKTHYFGSLAIAIDEENKIFRIIDGQQRITTSMIVLKAFYDSFKLKNINIQKELTNFIENKISNIYINEGVLTSQRAVKILFDNRTDPAESQTPKNNYDFVLNEFNSLNSETLLSYYTTFLTKFEVVTLAFKTSIDNEMDIFENLNTGGTKLEDWELIRSFVFSRMDPSAFIKYEKESNFYLNKTFIEPLYNVKKSNYKPQMSKFLTTYVRYLLAKEMKRTIVDDVHVEFKNCWPAHEKFSNYKKWKSSLDLMKKAFNVFMSFKFYYKERVSNPLHGYYPIIDFINSKDDITPLILNVIINEGTFNENMELIKINEKIIKVLKMMESYLIRSNTFGKNFNTQYDIYLIDNHQDISKNLWDFYKNKIPEKIVSIDRFCSDLVNNGGLRPSKIMNIITRIELRLRKTKIGATGYTKFEKTHEHIISQKLSYDNYDDKSVTEEEFYELLINNKDSIGNALILSQGDNSKASNKKFVEKIDIYKKSSYFAKGNINDPKIMNLITKKVFTFNDVSIRSKQIANFIKVKKIYYEENK